MRLFFLFVDVKKAVLLILLWCIGGGRLETVVRDVEFYQLESVAMTVTTIVIQRIVEGNAEDEVDVRMRAGTDHIGCQVDLVQLDIRRSGNVEDNPLRTVDGGFQQWRRDRRFGRNLRLVLAAGASHTHVGGTSARA